MPDIGDLIPSLRGTTSNGATLSLDDFKGQWVVIYFYPRDSTPGCTKQAQAFRDLHAEFIKRHTQVIGVSRDSVKSHANFSAKQALPFPLIADTDEIWCKTFDVIQEKVLYGKRHLGVVRSTFLLGPDLRLAVQWLKVKVPGHVQEVLTSIPLQ